MDHYVTGKIRSVRMVDPPRCIYEMGINDALEVTLNGPYVHAALMRATKDKPIDSSVICLLDMHRNVLRVSLVDFHDA